MIEVADYCPDVAGCCAEIYFKAVQIGTSHIYSQLQRDSWCKTCPTVAQYRERLNGLTTFVARSDGRIIGFMSFRENDGLLDLAFVHPEFAGRGVAYALYQAVLERAKRAGLARMNVVASEPSSS